MARASLNDVLTGGKTRIAAEAAQASQAALDGSAVAANASRHRLLNQPTLSKRVQALDQAVAAEAAQPPATQAAQPSAAEQP